jgi:acetate kinase
VDALVFTAGIGERSAEIRRRICAMSAWLGVELDAAANDRHATRITTPGSRVSAWVIPTNEELMIARHTGDLLGLRHPASVGAA